MFHWFFSFTLILAFAVHSNCLKQNGLLRASNIGNGFQFGSSVALSGDTLVVGSVGEASLNGDQQNTDAPGAGAAYVFIRNGTSWVQQTYLKAEHPSSLAQFGFSVAISGDTVVVGAPFGHLPGDELAIDKGAVYVFTRNGTTWSQQAFLRGNNTSASGKFGSSVALYGDTIVVGAPGEDSSVMGVANGAMDSGAAYVFVRNKQNWIEQAYLKASNTDAGDHFGQSVAIFDDTVIIGAPNEGSAEPGGDEGDNTAAGAGAAYAFVRTGIVWTQQKYLKAHNVGAGDTFGSSVAIFGDTVAVGAFQEDSPVGNDSSNAATDAGAVYLYRRSGASWNDLAYVKGSNTIAGCQFGYSVAIYDARLLVGAPGESLLGQLIAPESGAAYMFSLSGMTPYTEVKIKSSTAQPNFRFGQAVALSNQFAMMAAPLEGIVGTETGAVHAYQELDGPIPTSTQGDTGTSSSTETSMADASEQQTSSSKFAASLIGILTAGIGISLLLLIAISFILLRRKKRREADAEQPTFQLNDIHHTVDILKNVTLKEVIGRGAFGEVYRGDCDGTPCACKKLTSSDVTESVKEAKTLFKLSHPNIVRMFGIYISPNEDTYLVLEYVKGGSLLHFLPKNVEMLTASNLVDISIGVAQGMNYLEKKGIMHRDLSARNILITENLQSVISDFGLSRDNLYQRSSTSKIPVKWSAPEVLLQQDSTAKSDVFSFGIVLWEIFSFGMMPFSDLSNNEASKVICNKVITKKLEKPDVCPDKVYQLMIRCWSFDPSERPTFQDVLTDLQSVASSISSPRLQEEQSSSPPSGSEDHYN